MSVFDIRMVRAARHAEAALGFKLSLRPGGVRGARGYGFLLP
jgi:hypothetical protein